jgi:hypothetical protein
MLISLCSWQQVNAQIISTASLYDYGRDTSYEVNMKCDTIVEGFNTYITVYQIFGRKQPVSSKPLIKITISHFYPDHIIYLDVQLKPGTNSPSGGQDLKKSKFKYDKTYGTLIMVDGKDTLPFSEVNNFQKLILYFANSSKRTFIFCSQIGESYTNYPDLVKFDPVPDYLIHLNDRVYEKFLEEGTPERRMISYQKHLEQERNDSIRLDDSIKREMMIQFLAIRDTLHVTPSADTIRDYSLILRKEINEASLHFQCTKMKYDGILKIRMDTVGAIMYAIAERVDTSSYDYKSFEERMIENITDDTLYPAIRIFQNQSFTMFTEFELQVTAINDTLDQTGSKRTDTIYFEIQKYNEPVVQKKLLSVLDENGKYHFKLCFNETQGEKSFLITNIRKGSKQYGEIIFTE